MTVVLDTNFLTVPTQFGVDIFSESERILERRIEFVVLGSVVKELEKKLENASRPEKSKFRVALDLIERCKQVDTDEKIQLKLVDDQLLDYTETIQGILATNDKELRERALAKSIPVLFMRGKKRLELQGSVR